MTADGITRDAYRLHHILITTISAEMLPPDWDRDEPISRTQDIGTGRKT